MKSILALISDRTSKDEDLQASNIEGGLELLTDEAAPIDRTRQICNTMYRPLRRELTVRMEALAIEVRQSAVVLRWVWCTRLQHLA